MSGLWVSPTEFKEAEGLRKADLGGEVFTALAATGFDPASWLGTLPDPDPVLEKMPGAGMAALRSVLADAKVTASVQSRKLITLKKQDWILEAGHTEGEEPTEGAVRLRDNLARDLERVDMYNLFSEILDAPLFGYTVVELLWTPGNGAMSIADLVPRPPEWFGWGSDRRLKFIDASCVADDVDPRKAVAVRHFPASWNQYGLRLLSRCLWPVAIKKGGIRFWTTLCEKFGIPWVVGKARSGAPKAERQEMLTQLANMVQDAVAVVTAGTDVQVETTAGTTGSLHADLVRYMDNAIAMVIMGQTLTADIGQSGSKAAAETHKALLADYSFADEALICTFMENLAWEYGQVNAPGVLTPTFRFREPEDYDSQAELDKKLADTGVKFTKAHYVRRYNLAEDEFEVGEETLEALIAQDAGGGIDHAQGGDGYTPEQQALEDLADQGIGQAAKIFGTEVIERIKAIVQGAESFEDVQARLTDELGKGLGGQDLEALLQQALVAADLWGRFQVGEEVKNDG
jgi:phage gp29-like protein